MGLSLVDADLGPPSNSFDSSDLLSLLVRHLSPLDLLTVDIPSQKRGLGELLEPYLRFHASSPPR